MSDYFELKPVPNGSALTIGTVCPEIGWGKYECAAACEYRAAKQIGITAAIYPIKPVCRAILVLPENSIRLRCARIKYGLTLRNQKKQEQ